MGSYIAGMFLEEALKATGGRTADRQAFVKALRNAKLADSPRGPLKIDDLGNPIGDIYIRKVERNKSGELKNTIIKVYSNQTQFWSYDPKLFLANPVYSRDYPPAKNIEK
jgi:branched-chain amino acid transport system substrate-binding protein